MEEEENHSLIPKKEQRFKGKIYHDLWAAILFIFCLLGFIVVSAYFMDLKGISNPETDHGGFKVLIGLVVSLGAGLSLTFGYFFALQRFAGEMITASLIFSIFMQFVFSALFFVRFMANTRKNASAGVAAGLFFVLGILWIWCYQYWKERIPFAKVMLKSVLVVVKAYPGMMAVAILGLFAQMMFFSYWILSLISFAQLVQAKAISNAAAAAIGLFMLLMLYWTMQIIQNAIHITVAGVFGTWYFLGTDMEGEGIADIPVSNPTVASLKRALTTSMGPNCFGSLLISIVQVIRFMVHFARQQAENNDNVASALCLCCIECFVALFESLLLYFNRYAFTQVAIYGKSFCTSAQNTWELIKSRGIDAIINDDLIGNVLQLGAFTIGSLTCLTGFIFGNLAALPQPALVGLSIFSFLIGVLQFSIVASVVDSGVVTTFTILAEDPLAIAGKHPVLYQQIVRSYPHAVFF